MKRRFTITVDIDDGADGYSCVDRVGSHQYMINIRSDIHSNRTPVLPVIAHEIGHVLADEFGVTRVLTLYKYSREQPPETHTVGQILHSETKAWDVADEIHKAARKWCLGTYIEAYRDLPPNQKISHIDQSHRFTLRQQILKSVQEA